jgi:hypothetical protein
MSSKGSTRHRGPLCPFVVIDELHSVVTLSGESPTCSGTVHHVFLECALAPPEHAPGPVWTIPLTSQEQT